MIPDVNDCYFLSRIDNVIIDNRTNGDKIPLVQLKQKFPDVIVLEKQPLQYMKDYMSMHPNLWELIEQEKTNEQLTLF